MIPREVCSKEAKPVGQGLDRQAHGQAQAELQDQG